MTVTFTTDELTLIGDLLREQATGWHKIWLSPLVNEETRAFAEGQKDRYIALYSKVRATVDEAEEE